MGKYVLYWTEVNDEIKLKIAHKYKLKNNKEIMERYIGDVYMVSPQVFKPVSRYCSEYLIWSPVLRSYVIINLSMVPNEVESGSLDESDIEIIDVGKYLLYEFEGTGVQEIPVSLRNVAIAMDDDAKYMAQRYNYRFATKFIKSGRYTIFASYRHEAIKLHIFEGNKLIIAANLAAEKENFDKNMEILHRISSVAPGIIKVTEGDPTWVVYASVGSELLIRMSKYSNLFLYMAMPIKINTLEDIIIKKSSSISWA